MAVGHLLLGSIQSIHELELIVSLPNHLTGHVSITDISQELTRQVEKVAQGLDSEDEEESHEMDQEEDQVMKEEDSLEEPVSLSVNLKFLREPKL